MLYETYRPKSFNEVLGQEKIIKRIELLKSRGLGGRAYWLSGQSGTGKTTIAYIMAGMIADSCCISELDASELTPARVREVENQGYMKPLGKGGLAYIVNEAHGLRADTIRQLLVMLERLPKHVMVIFTTTSEAMENFDGVDAQPLLSRCICLQLARRGLADVFAEQVKLVALQEGLSDITDISPYVKLAQKCRNNMRAMYQAVESGEMVA